MFPERSLHGKALNSDNFEIKHFKSKEGDGVGK